MTMSSAPRLAGRVTSLKPSATVEMTERVRAARASGRKIFGLSSGDPNIETDPRLVAAAEQALRNGATHYGRSEEHTSELQSLMRNSYPVFCLKTTITPQT